jgi:glycerol-3-phosphate acyltransferase PlsY
MYTFILLAILAYLLGSVPFGYLIPKLKGIDIRTIGSKATSTTNVSRALGWRWAALSGVLDFLKGVLPTYLAITYLTNPWQIIFVALLPVVGHVFPVWLKFKGGKGAAPYFGACTVLVGVKVFIVFFIVWLLLVAIIRIMSLANLVFPIIFAAYLFLYAPTPYFIYGFISIFLIAFALRENIKRLIAGTEPKIPLKW